MGATSLHIKSHIPRTPGAIHRPHLLAKLETALSRKLTLISAAPGYGKTTIVSQYVETAGCPIVWHTVEEHERDFPNLLDHCLSALEAIAPGITENIPRPDAASPAELAIAIGRYLRQAHKGDFVYILDDLHHLDDMPR